MRIAVVALVKKLVIVLAAFLMLILKSVNPGTPPEPSLFIDARLAAADVALVLAFDACVVAVLADVLALDALELADVALEFADVALDDAALA